MHQVWKQKKYYDLSNAINDVLSKTNTMLNYYSYFEVGKYKVEVSYNITRGVYAIVQYMYVLMKQLSIILQQSLVPTIKL